MSAHLWFKLTRSISYLHAHAPADNGGVVSYTKHVRDTAANSLAMRNSLAGIEEAVIDLMLLSQTHLLVGTVGSSYSQTAKLIGAPFFVSVGVEYENKLR